MNSDNDFDSLESREELQSLLALPRPIKYKKLPLWLASCLGLSRLLMIRMRIVTIHPNHSISERKIWREPWKYRVSGAILGDLVCPFTVEYFIEGSHHVQMDYHHWPCCFKSRCDCDKTVSRASEVSSILEDILLASIVCKICSKLPFDQALHESGKIRAG